MDICYLKSEQVTTQEGQINMIHLLIHYMLHLNTANKSKIMYLNTASKGKLKL